MQRNKSVKSDIEQELSVHSIQYVERNHFSIHLQMVHFSTNMEDKNVEVKNNNISPDYNDSCSEILHTKQYLD